MFSRHIKFLFKSWIDGKITQWEAQKSRFHSGGFAGTHLHNNTDSLLEAAPQSDLLHFSSLDKGSYLRCQRGRGQHRVHLPYSSCWARSWTSDLLITSTLNYQAPTDPFTDSYFSVFMVCTWCTFLFSQRKAELSLIAWLCALVLLSCKLLFLDELWVYYLIDGKSGFF